MGNQTAVDQYADWVGREEESTASLHASVVQAMAATLDCSPAPGSGEPLPAGWQWLFFNPVVPRSSLEADGHPAKGGFLPPIELPRRMWAGSRIQYLSDLPVGATATKKSRILKVAHKSGKSGALCFVTVAHSISTGGAVCITEQQDLVYKEAAPVGGKAARPPQRYTEEAQWRDEINADSTLLFRYSALTFNGHRIHYDLPYARDEEGYPDLVVQGPLTATLLQRFAVQHGVGRRLAAFDFRGVSPLFVNRPFTLEGREESADTLALWARGPDGELAMSATATFASAA